MTPPSYTGPSLYSSQNIISSPPSLPSVFQPRLIPPTLAPTVQFKSPSLAFHNASIIIEPDVMFRTNLKPRVSILLFLKFSGDPFDLETVHYRSVGGIAKFRTRRNSAGFRSARVPKIDRDLISERSRRILKDKDLVVDCTDVVRSACSSLFEARQNGYKRYASASVFSGDVVPLHMCNSADIIRVSQEANAVLVPFFIRVDPEIWAGCQNAEVLMRRYFIPDKLEINKW